MFTKLAVIALGCIALSWATPIDNGVTGDPEIECGPTSIQITFNTQKPFSGHTYVKGLFDKEADGCRTNGANNQAIGQISLPFDKCGVTRERSLNPKGVFVRTTVVISFHPRFLTKIDRAYTVQCFYMEADKTVSTGIEVSEITTGFQTQVVPMPICRYEILDAAQNGKPVAFAIIGQGVFHKWTCDTDTTDTFCMTVHDCFVDDGKGDRLDLLNDQGCALDKYLMNNLEYPSDLMAVKEVHVFKYADRPALQFQCQITILVKDPGQPCGRPTCSEPGGQGDGSGASGAPAPAAAPKVAKASSSAAAKAAPAPAPAAKAAPPPPPPAPKASSSAASSSAASSSAASSPPKEREVEAVRLPVELAPEQIQQQQPVQQQQPNDATDLSRARARRSAQSVDAHPNAAGTMDVSQSLNTLDIEDRQSYNDLTAIRRHALYTPTPTDNICLSSAAFTTVVVFGVAIIAAMITVAACLVLRKGGKQ